MKRKWKITLGIIIVISLFSIFGAVLYFIIKYIVVLVVIISIIGLFIAIAASAETDEREEKIHREEYLKEKARLKARRDYDEDDE